MTSNTQSDIYTKSNPTNMTVNDVLQKLYSYNESTGPDVGGVLEDLRAEQSETTDIEYKITTNSDSFRAPKEDSEKHFTDIIGEAREAAANENPEKSHTLIVETIIPLLSEAVTVFETIEQDVESNQEISQETVDNITAVRTTYEHMVKLATAAQEKTTPSTE